MLIVLLAFFSISSGWHVLYILTYVLLTLFILSWLWARYSLSNLVFRRSSATGRVQVGEMFDERLMLDNVGIMPKLWVQIADGSTLPGHRAGYVASMGGRKRATWRARTVCRQGVVFNLARLLPPVEIHSASSGGASSSPPKKNSWCCHALYRSPISRSLPAACLDVAEVRGEHCRQPPTQPLFVITPSVTPSIVFTGVPPRIIIN